MTKLPFNFVGLAAVAFLAFSNLSVQAGDLAGLLKDTGWDKVIGTWVSGGTETTFTMKGADLHSLTKMGDTERNTTLKLDGGTVKVDSADNKGGTSGGTAVFSAGKAVFTIKSNPAEGEARELTINYTLDGDSLSVQMEGSDSATTFTRK